jgi:hypothetical protein
MVAEAKVLGYIYIQMNSPMIIIGIDDVQRSRSDAPRASKIGESGVCISCTGVDVGNSGAPESDVVEEFQFLEALRKVVADVGVATGVRFSVTVEGWSKLRSVAAPGRIVMTTAGALRLAVIVSHSIDFVQRPGCWARQRIANARVRVMSLRPGCIETCKPQGQFNLHD